MKLQVHTESRTLSETLPDKPYGDWYSERQFTVTGVHLTDESLPYYIHTIDTVFDVNVGDLVFVLSATYSSGDSFGHSIGNGTVLAIFKDRTLAYAASNAVKDSKEYYVTIKNDNGEDVQIMNPAAGYFESLEYIQVQHFFVSPPRGY